MPKAQLIVEFDTTTGQVQVSGPFGDPIIMAYLFHEGQRRYELWRVAQQKEEKKIVPVASLEGLVMPPSNGHPR